ncbi:MAG: response regulator [Magnetococcales bacterium]|nr:response regulator [Magnetococcales bacterium]
MENQSAGMPFEGDNEARKSIVLLVDDQPENIDIIRSALDEHFQILVATHGVKALQVVRRVVPDIILLDIMMPVMDGYETCRRLKEDPLTAAIPVIFLTAKTEFEDEAKGLALGAIDYIRKPSSPQIILARVKNIEHLLLARRALELKNFALESARLKAEEALARLAENERDLHAAMVTAERASMAKSEFLAVMSHEIRTPLNGILGMTELLMDLEMSDEYRLYVETIRRSGENLLVIINDILDFSKIEAGRLELEAIPFSLWGLLDELQFIFGQVASSKELAFRVEHDGLLPRDLIGDPVRVRQVLTNLLSNALKFTEFGGVSLQAEPLKVTADQARIAFMVRDTGIGISPENFARLFDAFSQVDSSTTRKFGGTGLGLSITNRLVRMMGGEITVQSQLGIGSTFRVEIPFKMARSALPEGIVRPPGEGVPAEIPANTLILLVEDDPINLAVIKGMLQPYRVRIEAAQNGRVALGKLAKSNFDLVLMDCLMPEMDGYAACREFRGMELTSGVSRRTPVIALTANAMQGDREKCLAAGMDDYLSKPFKRHALVEIIALWLARARSQGGLEIPPPTETLREREPIDREKIQELQEDLGEDFFKVLRTFQAGLPDRSARVWSALQANDANQVHMEVHSLKSLSAQFGLVRLREVVVGLDNKARTGSLNGTSDLAERLMEEIRTADAAISAYLAGRS